jgi:hypothetical protein
MGLDMHTKKKLTEKTYPRYQQASKKEKTTILDEFVAMTDYNRDYAAHLLATRGKTRILFLDGKPVKLTAGPLRNQHRNGKQGGRPKRYGPRFQVVLKAIWEYFDHQGGKLLAPLIRLMIEFLVAAGGVERPPISEENRQLLLEVSPATIDRLLKAVKANLRLKGKRLTRPGPLLKHQIPVRVSYAWDERKPGFFELDTVSHCGIRSSGECEPSVRCQTLTLTDVYSGWTEEQSLRNRAHRRVKEATARVKDQLPFPLLGIDSDNGGEFINQQLLGWCQEHHIQFTRGRPYRKNDNCFVEQKNGDMVRKTVGYFRFDTDAEQAALAEVYRYLCPLNNYWYPTIKVIGKRRLENGRYQKEYEPGPKTPYQRLVESPDIEEGCKAELRRRAALYNPVKLKGRVDQAVTDLLRINREKGDTAFG